VNYISVVSTVQTSTTVTLLAIKRERTHNHSHYAFQGHSRSPILSTNEKRMQLLMCQL